MGESTLRRLWFMSGLPQEVNTPVNNVKYQESHRERYPRNSVNIPRLLSFFRIQTTQHSRPFVSTMLVLCLMWYFLEGKMSREKSSFEQLKCINDSFSIRLQSVSVMFYIKHIARVFVYYLTRKKAELVYIEVMQTPVIMNILNLFASCKLNLQILF